MKQWLLLLTAFSLINCKIKQQPKKYYVSVDQNGTSNSGQRERQFKVSEIEATNDSAAYWQGVITYKANKTAEKGLTEKGVKDLPTIAKGFDVLDENKKSIVWKISASLKAHAVDFIDEHE